MFRHGQLPPPQLPAWALPWVTLPQAEEPRGLIEVARVELAKFLAYFGIARVEHLPAARYVEALGKLRARQQGNGTAAAKAAAPLPPGRPAR